MYCGEVLYGSWLGVGSRVLPSRVSLKLEMSLRSKQRFFFPMARQPYMGLGLLVSSRFYDHTHLRHTTFGRTSLDEGPARRRDLYLTTHNAHKRQTSMPLVGFEPRILVSERPKTHALDRTATGIGLSNDN
jgi:hypothetical protein